MRVYIAGKITAQERLREERRLLWSNGIVCESSWLDVGVKYPEAFSQTGEVTRDLHEIAESYLVILDTLDVSETGGREFEAGYAFGHGIPFWRVGPKRHIFHALASREFENWSEVRAVLQLKEAA